MLGPETAVTGYGIIRWMRRCPACGKPVPPKPPEEPGPAKTYGGDACRAAAYRRRHCRPLGSELIAQMGIEDRSPLEMLREQEIVDLADLAVVDAWIVAQRHR